MQYNTMKKAEIITMLNDKDAKIAELEAALKTANYTIGRYEDLMKNLVATSKNAIANAEQSQKVAEDSQKIAADAINVAKKMTGYKTTGKKNAEKKLNAPKPEKNNDKPSNDEKKPTTREEALTAKYGDIDARREYMKKKNEEREAINAQKSKIRNDAYETIKVEVAKTGKRLPYKKWQKKYNDLVAKMMKEAGLE